MRLRLRDGDHHRPLRWSSPYGWQLQCGSVSGTEITGEDPEIGDKLLDAAMRLRLRDGDHMLSHEHPLPITGQLQCGSVSGTEITGLPD